MGASGVLVRYGFTHSLRTFVACAAQDAITMETEDSEVVARTSPEIWKKVKVAGNPVFLKLTKPAWKSMLIDSSSS